MDDFIKSAASRLGLDESTAKNATGTALGFLKERLGSQFSPIAEKLPEAERLIGSAAQLQEAGKGGGGGLLGSVSKAASSMLGGSAGEGLEVMSALQGLGLSADQSGSFITMLINFIKEKVGAGTIDQVTDKIPALKAFVG